jgi:hypothetical protein
MGAFADLLDEINSRPRGGTLSIRVGNLPFEFSFLEEMVDYAAHDYIAPTFTTQNKSLARGSRDKGAR